MNMLFFHEMCAIIHSISGSEVLFPRPDTHYSALSVMVMSTEESEKEIFAGRCRRVRNRCPAMGRIFTHCRECKMKSLSVSVFRTIYPVKKTCHSRYKGKPRKVTEIQRSIERWRHQNVRNTFYTDRMDRAK